MDSWFVTPNDIESWVKKNKRSSEEILPLMIEKLVRASSQKFDSCEFPNGDGISTGGYDGTVVSAISDSEFVCDGTSVWEIGTNQAAQAKANDDLEKRSQKPLGFTPKETVYYQVSPRVWTKAQNWQKEKNGQQIWKEVRALNSTSLSTWLYQCPAVHRWFAHLVGKRYPDLWDIDQSWEAFVSRTSTQITTEFLQHNRDKKYLPDQLEQAACQIELSSEDTSEPYGFLLSIIRDLPNLSCRTLIVRSQAAWDYISEIEGNLVLVAYEFKPENIGYAISHGHHAVVFSSTSEATEGSWELPRINRIDRTEAIQCLGFTEVEAHDIFSETLGYFSPLCRSSFLNPIDRKQPKWTETDIRVLIAVFFCFEWNDLNENDQEVLQNISGIRYKEIVDKLQKLATQDSPFVRKVGGTWQVISRMDAWFYLQSQIGSSTLSSAQQVFIDVLNEIDPALELPVKDQYMAAVRGKVPKYSNALKKGLANTLALLSISNRNEITFEVENIAERVFSSLSTSEQWSSLDHVMRLLAEANPEICLSSIENQLLNEPEVFVNLFAESDSSIFGSCKYSELLWTLETLAGSEKYFTRVVICLARLASIDPKTSGYVNSPLGSLNDLFIGWINNTSIRHDDRITVVKKVLIPRFPDISWVLIKGLVNIGHGSTSGVSKTTYRDWSLITKKEVSGKTYHSYTSALSDIWLDLFTEYRTINSERLGDMLGNLASFDKQNLNQLETYLLNIEVTEMPADAREACANQLRHFIARHREFPDSNWSAPEEIIKKIENIYIHFEPTDIQLKNKHLFESYRVDFIDPVDRVNTPAADQDDLTNNVRIMALEEVFSEGNIDGVVSFIEKLEKKNHVGHYLTKVNFSQQIEPTLLKALGVKNGALNEVAKHYFSSIFYNNEGELIRVLESTKQFPLNVLLCARLNDTLLGVVEKSSTKLKNEYWQKMNCYFLHDSEIQYLAKTTSELIQRSRYSSAIKAHTCAITRKQLQSHIDVKLLVTAVFLFATENDAEESLSKDLGYELCEAIKFIQGSSELEEDQKRQIEWLYAYPLQHQDFSPKLIIEGLKDDPQSFVNLICWIYRSRDQLVEREEIKEESSISEVAKKNRAKSGLALLDAFRVLPGTNGERIDSKHLKQWVTTAREILIKKGRTITGDITIGELLSRSPVGDDGHWPHEAVRCIIEDIDSEQLNQGIYTGIKNSRGIVTKSAYEGGEQEGNLAEKYRNFADALQMVYPRTAKLLVQIAESYDHDAKYSDERVELMR